METLNESQQFLCNLNGFMIHAIVESLLVLGTSYSVQVYSNSLRYKVANCGNFICLNNFLYFYAE